MDAVLDIYEKLSAYAPETVSKNETGSCFTFTLTVQAWRRKGSGVTLLQPFHT